MIDRRKTFPCYDYALCDALFCPHKNNCVRNLTHQKAVEEGHNVEYITYLIIEPQDFKDCSAFVNAEHWMKRFDGDNDEFDYGHNMKYTNNTED